MNGQQITNEEYHSLPSISATGLKTFLKSPAHYKAAKENNEDTPAFRVGRMIHSGVLEPETFYDNYGLIEPDTFLHLFPVCDVDRRTKEGREKWNSIVASGLFPEKTEEDSLKSAEKYAKEELLKCGVEPITQADLNALTECMKACTGMFPVGGKAELSFSTTIDGVECRCRPDWLVEDQGVCRIYDLKTCQSVEGIDSLFYKYGYHIQQVFYCMVLESLGMTVDREMQFVFVEKKPPFDVVVRTMDMALYDATEVIVRNALERYKTCLATDTWPGIEPERTLKQAVCPSWIESGLLPDLDMSEFYGDDNAAC
jgi:hypothetical protein